MNNIIIHLSCLYIFQQIKEVTNPVIRQKWIIIIMISPTWKSRFILFLKWLVSILYDLS